jgi:uncharacterized protein YyaL (SSP411 family)
VPDERSLADPRVAALVRGGYVPVRVDTDRRPDLNDRYNQGGWPTVAILFPDGRLLAGGTYIPPAELAELLEKCTRFWEGDRDRIERYLEGREFPGEEEPQGLPAPRPSDLAVVRGAVLAVADPVHPGFFREPKFLHPDMLAFLLDLWEREDDAEAGETARSILRTMASSAVFDPVSGGFFRYAVRRDWTEPHYEKLLCDNAEMLSILARAYELGGDGELRDCAALTLRFLLVSLLDPATGAFLASRDADQAYYRLPGAMRGEREPPRADRTLVAEYNALAVSALVRAHRAFDAEGAGREGGGLLGRAEAAMGRIESELRAGEGRTARFPGGPAGLLQDAWAVAAARLDLHEATGRGEHLAEALAGAERALLDLHDPARRAFRDRPGHGGEPPGASPELRPFPGNARMARLLLRLGRAAGRPDLVSAGEGVLGWLAGSFARSGAFAAPYGSALVEYRRGAGGGCPSAPGGACPAP